MKIRTKIVLIAFVILLLAITINVAISSYILAREYSDHFQSLALVIGQSLALQMDRLLSYGIYLDEVRGFEQQCREIVSEYKETSYAMIVDVEGKILFHNDPTQQGRRLSDAAQLSTAKSTQAQVIQVHPQPGQEYYEATVPIFDSLSRHVGAVKVGLPVRLVAQRVQTLFIYSGMAGLVSLVLAVILLVMALSRWVTNPLARLTAAVQEILQRGAAQAERVEIRSRDEIGQLANGFNSMTDQIRELIGTLEQRVAERTTELRQTTAELVTRSGELEKLNLNLQIASQQAERRAAQLAASAQVARAASQLRDLDQLLPQVTQLISQTFGYYHVGIFITDELGRFAVLRAANSEGGQRMLARGHKLAIGPGSIVGYVVSTSQPRIALDVGADPVHFDNPDLPQTRSELALPLRVGDRTFGALDVQSTQPGAFTEEDVAVLGTLADQIAVAIENARLFQQTQVALREAEEAAQRYLRQEWEQLLPTLPVVEHEYTTSGVPPVRDAPLPEVEQAIQQGSVVMVDSVSEARGPYTSALAVPVKLRDQVIGVIDLHEVDTDRQWSAEDVALVTAIADQVALALENARLFEQAQRRAQRERLITQIATRVRAAPDTESILRTAVLEIRRVLGTSHGVIRLGMQGRKTELDRQEG